MANANEQQNRQPYTGPRRLYVAPDLRLETFMLSDGGIPNTNRDKMDPAICQYLDIASRPYTPGQKDFIQVIRPPEMNRATFKQSLETNGLTGLEFKTKFYWFAWVTGYTFFKQPSDKVSERFANFQFPSVALLEATGGMSLINITPHSLDLALLEKSPGDAFDGHAGRAVDYYTVGTFDSPFLTRMTPNKSPVSVPYFRVKNTKLDAQKLAEAKQGLPESPFAFLSKTIGLDAVLQKRGATVSNVPTIASSGGVRTEQF